jgi:GNAT superfamily N-acetyltransferase
MRLELRPLAQATECLPIVQDWFEAEWPGHYGPGGAGDARADLQAYCRLDTLPLGLLAFLDGAPCGFAALKDTPFPHFEHLHPWAGAAYVRPGLRRLGIGQALIGRLEVEAAALGFDRLYSATATSASLLARCGWQRIDTAQHDGEAVGIFARMLAPTRR